MPPTRPIRVVLAKVGLDGHDRGIQVVARALRDAGMEVIYTGLWQTPDAVVRAVEDEDADVVGVSLLSGAHTTLVPVLIDGLRAKGLGRVQVIVGGIIPAGDVPALLALGVAKVFTPGAGLTEIAQFIRGAVERSRGAGGPSPTPARAP
ncbi:MAG: cobalamin B12-binding domain-containing protein [Planctomycetia bacterium]|nr:cobalamin B12-binding domain-containing protein [Planctomycetia bacterium]